MQLQVDPSLSLDTHTHACTSIYFKIYDLFLGHATAELKLQPTPQAGEHVASELKLLPTPQVENKKATRRKRKLLFDDSIVLTNG